MGSVAVPMPSFSKSHNRVELTQLTFDRWSGATMHPVFSGGQPFATIGFDSWPHMQELKPERAQTQRISAYC